MAAKKAKKDNSSQRAETQRQMAVRSASTQRAETQRQRAMKPPYYDAATRAKNPVDGGALRAAGRRLAKAQQRFEAAQPKGYDITKTPRINRSTPTPKKPKWGRGDSGGSRGLPGYWEV